MIKKLLRKLPFIISTTCVLIMRFLRQSYLKKHVKVYTFNKNTPIKKINPDIECELKEIRDFNDLEKYKQNISPIDFAKFNIFLRHGCVGYFARNGEELVSIGWLADPKKYIHSPYLKVLFENCNDKMCHYIFYCHTFEKYKGKNIYPYILSYIINKHKNEDIYIDTDLLNIPSQKGIEKVGFEFKYVLSYLRLFGINLNISKDGKKIK